MRLSLIAVGKLKNTSWRALAEDYAKRIRRQARLDIVEVRDADPEREGERLLAALETARASYVFVLSEEGSSMPSRELAGELAKDPGAGYVFVIGGAYGLSDEVKAAGKLLRLSVMTFPHEMARVVLLEQLYRALSINAGSGYHH